MPKDLGSSREGQDNSEVEQYELEEVQRELVNELLQQAFLPEQRDTSQYLCGSEPIDSELGRCLITSTYGADVQKKVQVAIRDEEGDTYFLQHVVDESPDAEQLHECSDDCFCAMITPNADLPFHGLDTENNARVISPDEARGIIMGLWAMSNDLKRADPADARSTEARNTVRRLQDSAPRHEIKLTYHPAFLVAMDKIFRQHYR